MPADDDFDWAWATTADLEVQLNHDGEPRLGTLWQDALVKLERLREERWGQSKHSMVEDVIVRLRWVRNISWLNPIPPPHNQCINGFQHVIDVCGRVVLQAYANNDAAFFAELARVAKIDLGNGRKEGITKEELVIEKAIELWHEGNSNPSRESVKDAVSAALKPYKIRDKDWPGYFKRCKLDFLVSYKGAGRPSKTHPVKRSKVVMPRSDGHIPF